ncbi:hypothetical protein [Agrilutibacter solisilvae]|uniref:Uncharacterized protein n=1 Tax=Agrilutibacter solisilvae TaxID=2763317 RepID=A0A974XYB7_9GAMM|nr:hypothetical protein [Lysobacter solisilvae]QSX77878.1 hypothetical protein I8J32_014285 [Lysobacter solisilvae]
MNTSEHRLEPPQSHAAKMSTATVRLSKRDPAADGWPSLPAAPQVRRRSTDALPWRPESPRMRWER